uniref:Putative secreted protein n=1 Tax=Ixodes scapularis TaxID=6945 RepID=Q4PN79_IXOSC|nr:putative secreted protein [Ixodes scapularis]
MNTFIVVLVSSLVLTTFGVFADSDQQPQVSTGSTSGICSSQKECSRDQCCLETFSGDMVLVTCSPLARPGAPCSNLTEGDEPYKDGCPCIPGYECVDGTCTATPQQPVAVE